MVEESLKWYVTDTLSKKTLIMEGLGLGRLPIHMVEKEIQDGSLVVIKHDKKHIAKVNVAKLKKKALGPIGKRFWEYFENLAVS